jgi:hypothetical protein
MKKSGNGGAAELANWQTGKLAFSVATASLFSCIIPAGGVKPRLFR